MHPAANHLAELNFGELRYDWDDPRVAEFVAGLIGSTTLSRAAPVLYGVCRMMS